MFLIFFYLILKIKISLLPLLRGMSKSLLRVLPTNTISFTEVPITLFPKSISEPPILFHILKRRFHQQ